jgi:hypothetical protein
MNKIYLTALVSILAIGCQTSNIKPIKVSPIKPMASATIPVSIIHTNIETITITGEPVTIPIIISNPPPKNAFSKPSPTTYIYKAEKPLPKRGLTWGGWWTKYRALVAYYAIIGSILGLCYLKFIKKIKLKESLRKLLKGSK